MLRVVEVVVSVVVDIEVVVAVVVDIEVVVVVVIVGEIAPQLKFNPLLKKKENRMKGWMN